MAAAGNGGTSGPRYAAAYPGVIAVAATDQDDQRASFSNYGSWVDVAAPGVLSTVPGGPHLSALTGLLADQGPSGIASSALPWTPTVATRITARAA